MAEQVNIQPFSTTDVDNIGLRWKKWIKRLERLLDIKNVTDDKKKITYLFYYGGDQLEDIYSEQALNTDTFKEVVDKLTERFNPKTNNQLHIYNFRAIQQHEGEPFDEFVQRLKDQGEMCNFKDLDDEVASQIIIKCKSQNLKHKALEKEDLKLKDVVKMGRLEESIEQQIKGISSQSQPRTSFDDGMLSVNAVNAKTSYKTSKKPSRNRNSGAASGESREKRCFKCDRKYPHEKECPAKDETCWRCGKVGHFEKCCKSKTESPESSSKKTKRVRKMRHDNADDSDSSNAWSICVNQIKRVVNKLIMPVVTLLVCLKNVDFYVDTGSEINIIDKDTFNCIRSKPRLFQCNKKIYGYGNKTPLSAIGEFTARCKYNGSYKKISFVVIDGSYGNLLSYKTSVDLGIINQIRNVSIENKKIDSKVEALWKKYPSVFSGKIGLLKNHSVKLHINKEIKPVLQKLRPVPFHLRALVEKEVQNMLDQDIIEPVKGPTPWVSPIVVVPKPNRPGEIRICTDAREANKAIERERHSTPVIEDLAVLLNGASYISKFDLKAGYTQIMLDEESRYITAFCTHMGVFQYKRLNFGINAAAEIFQKNIEQIILGLDGCINISDDVIIYGSDKQEHDARLHRVLERFEQSGLTVNVDKCEFFKRELDFFGFHFSASGISVENKKKEALLNAKSPKSVGEVRSILGLANYCGRFIQNLATVCKPLRELTKKGKTWKWEDVHERSLTELKRSLTTEAMAYFNRDWTTVLSVDASPVGLGAVLSQYDPKNPDSRKVIMYASRGLTDVESRYSQVEKESLALVWGCEKFHIYLYAKEFEVITDNKAVELIFGKPTSKPKARIERWCLRLMPYKFKVTHKPGLGNIADFLSRNPEKDMKTSRVDVNIADRYVNMIASSSIPRAISKKEFLNAIEQDTKLKSVIDNMKNNKRISEEPYAKIFTELSVTSSGLLLRGNRVVIPESLRQRVMKIAHSGHQGIVRTKRLIRNNVWFPNIDIEVEKMVKSCTKCQINTNTTHIEPFRMSKLPSNAWEELCIDFYGPMRDGKYLCVVIDEYSRYPIVKKISSTSCKVVIPVLKEIFSSFGIPTKLKSDNGPPFSSYEFKVFSEQVGFKHARITPLWPRANGICERFMRNLSKVLKNSSVDGKFDDELMEFLASYRSTPHTSTNRSPVSLLLEDNLVQSRFLSIQQLMMMKKIP